MQWLVEILSETFYLFVEMSPYLLLGLVFVGLLNYFVSKDLVKKHIGKNNISSIIKASIFGIPLPLCSCSVIPTAVFMSDNNASKPAVVSFLASTPQTGIDSIIATYGMMGPVFAIYRPIAALIMGISTGIINKLLVKEQKDKFKFGLNVMSEAPATSKEEKKEMLIEKTLRYPFIEFIDKISPQFITGLFVAGLISFLFPEDFFTKYQLGSGLIAMLLMLIISAPMYICATASIPIAIALMMKGFSPGAAFVFLSAGPVTNAASYAILNKSIGNKTNLVFTISVLSLSVIFGLLLDQVFLILNINPHTWLSNSVTHHHSHFSYLQIFSGIIFGALILASFWRLYFKKYFSRAI